MTAPDALEAARFMDRMRVAAYRRLGRSLPDFTPAAATERDRRSMAALKPGGDVEQALIEGGMAPGSAREQVARTRQAMEQIDRHRPKAQAAGDAGPVLPTVDPLVRSILAEAQRQVESLAIDGDPSLPGKLHGLRGRVAADLLPTGELNARALRVPRTSAYAVAFEPVFFDFMFYASNAIAGSIDPAAARSAAARFARGDESVTVADAIRWGDPEPLKAFLALLLSFTLDGHPPVLTSPYRDEAFWLAEHLRRSGMLFVMAHEYAHILLGHVDERPTHQASWVQELEADHLGWRLTDTWLGHDGAPEGIRAMGAHFFFACCVLVDMARDAVRTGVSRSILDVVPVRSHDGTEQDTLDAVRAAEAADAPSHPPLSLRVMSFNRMVRRGRSVPGWLEARFFSTLVFEVAGQFWMRMEPYFLQRHKGGSRLAPAWEGWDSFVADAGAGQS